MTQLKSKPRLLADMKIIGSIAITHQGKEYCLSELDSGQYWLESESGEGLTVREKDFWTLLDTYFLENF